MVKIANDPAGSSKVHARALITLLHAVHVYILGCPDSEPSANNIYTYIGVSRLERNGVVESRGATGPAGWIAEELHAERIGASQRRLLHSMFRRAQKGAMKFSDTRLPLNIHI